MIARLAIVRGLYRMHRAMGFGPIESFRWALDLARKHSLRRLGR